MSSISFTAHGRCARATVCEPITTGSVGLSVSFAFDAAWSGLQKTAIFLGSGMAVDLVLSGDAATVPPEVLTIPGGDLRVGVWGADPDGNVIIPTVWANVGEIVPGAAPSGFDPDPPTPSWAAQVQEIAQDALDTANSVREDADAGAFDGATYTPAVSAGGDLSWTNDKGKPNPPTVNIKGPEGQPGQTGATPDISIGTVETLPPGSPATATITGTAENPVLSFGIPEGQQGAPGEVTQAEFDDLADEVTQQKSALTESDSALGTLTEIRHKIYYQSGYLIYVGNDIGTTTSLTPIADAGFECTVIECSAGDKIDVEAKGGIGARAWAFLDSDNKLLSRAAAGVIETILIAPTNAAKCVLNNKKSEYTNKSCVITGEDTFAITKNMIDEGSAYVIQDVELTRGFYSYSGSPSHKTFTSLDYYESASIDCSKGEKYSISGYVLNSTTAIGYYWDANDNLISSIGTSEINEYSDKLIEIPDGCVNFTVTSYRNNNTTHTIVKKWVIVGAESEKEKHPLIGKKFISFGPLPEPS